MHRFTPIFAAAALIAAALIPAGASAQAGPAREVVCESQSPQAVCQFMAAGLLFEALRGDIVDPTDPHEVHVVGELVLVAPVLDVVMEEADVLFVRLPDGTLWIQYGVARAPLASLPLLEDVPLPSQPPIVGFGLADRYELRELFEDADDPATTLPLAENYDSRDRLIEPTYLFFHAVDGMDINIPIPLPDTGAGDPPTLPLSKSQATTIILDPRDPYIYFSNEGGNGLDKKLEKKAKEQLAKRQKGKKDQEEDRRRAEEEKRKAEEKKRKQEEKDAKKKGNKKKSDKKDKKKSKKSKKSKKKNKKKGLPKGTVAFSALGGIPYDAERAAELGDVALTDDGANFDGHLFVKMPVPMGPLLGMEGPTVVRIDNGVQMGGNGDASVTVPFVGDVLGLTMPLGTASAGLTVDGGEQSVYFVGTMSPDDSPFHDIVPILPTGELKVAGQISSQLEKSFLEATGRYELDASELGKMAGIKLGRLQRVDGLMRLDREGFLLDGTMHGPEIPGVRFDGQVQVTAFFSGPNPIDSFMRIRGKMSVGAIDLGAGASLMISPKGVIVEGSFDTSLVSVRLLGELTINGPVLEGQASVRISLDDLNQAIADARAEVEKAQRAVNTLEGDLANMRNTVRDERRSRSKAFQDAQRGVTYAQGEVNKINGAIRINNDKIDDLKSDRTWWRNKSCGLNPICKGEKEGTILYLSGRITFYEGLNWTEKNVALPAARGALDLANKTLAEIDKGLNAIPVDADPRVIAILGSLEVASEALKLAKAALSFEIPASGELTADILLRLDKRGISGTLKASLNGVPVSDGRVKLGKNPEACISLVGLGTACAPF